MKILLTSTLIITLISFPGCNKNEANRHGKLFIIGGGEKADAMMNELVDMAGIKKHGYMFILPMASSVPDSSILWAREDFSVTGITSMPGFAFKKGKVPPQQKIDSLKAASLIFICGGDQEGGFTSIEEDNIETIEGLGLLQDVIIDQHFIKRQRLNRLVSVSIENPDQLCVGIDESTAIIVDGDQATVTGSGQVIVLNNKSKYKTVKDNLLGTDGLELSVYLPGDKFSLR